MLQFPSSNPNHRDDHLDEMNHGEFPPREDESTVKSCFVSEQLLFAMGLCSLTQGAATRSEPPGPDPAPLLPCRPSCGDSRSRSP